MLDITDHAEATKRTRLASTAIRAAASRREWHISADGHVQKAALTVGQVEESQQVHLRRAAGPRSPAVTRTFRVFRVAAQPLAGAVPVRRIKNDPSREQERPKASGFTKCMSSAGV